MLEAEMSKPVIESSNHSLPHSLPFLKLELF